MTLTPSFDQFIDEALFGVTSFKLSYKDPNQKWMIRNHLIGLLHDFPSLVPSTDTFVQIDGISMNILNISGYLLISSSLPHVPLIIWIHENYPLMSPMVFIVPNPECLIHQNHPFIDCKSGFVTLPNVIAYDNFNLCEFVRNLVVLFQRDHPSMPSLVEKNAIIEVISGKINRDMLISQVENVDNIEKLSNVQDVLLIRCDLAENCINELLKERDNLEIKINEISKYNKKLSSWLRNNTGHVRGGLDGETIIATIDDESELLVDCLSKDRALDDVIYALDKALEQGLVSFEGYMKQIRMLAREQFFLRAKLVKFEGGGHNIGRLF